MDEMAVDGKLEQWDDHHNALDEYLSIDSSRYIMVYQATAQNGKAVIVIDIKAEAVTEFMQGLNLGDGSRIVRLSDAIRRSLMCVCAKFRIVKRSLF